jgi:autotransporter translocation and assembly factor TamB
MRRLLFWIVASIVGCLLLALIGLGFYSRTEHFRAWAREQILAALQPTINGAVTLERISGSLWSGLSFHNLLIQQQGTDVLRVANGSLTLDLMAQVISYIRSSSIQVGTLTLDEPIITLKQDPQGQWNINQLIKPSPSSPEQSSPLSVAVNDLRITNGRLNVIQSDGAITQLTPIAVAGSLAVRPVGMQLDLPTLSFALARPGIPNIHWQGGISYDTSAPVDRLTLSGVELRTAHSLLRVSGAIENLATPTVAITANVEHLAVAELRAHFPTLPLQQDLTGSVSMNGPLSALQVAATAQAPDGAVTTNVTTDLTQTPVQYNGTLKVSELNIPKAVQLATNSGVVSGQATIVGKGQEVMQGTFAVTVTNLQVGQKPIGTVTSSGKIDNQHVQLTGNAQGVIGTVDWQGQIGLAQPLSYDVNLKARDLILERVLAQPPSVPVHLNVDVHVQGRGMTWPDLNSTATVTLLPSRVGELTDVQGQFNGNVRARHVVVDTFTLAAQDTTFTAQGQLAGLQKTDAGSLTYSLDSKNITPWLALVGQTGSGAVRSQGKVTGTLAAMNVTGSAQVTGLRVANSTVRNGSLTYAGEGIGGSQPKGQATIVAQDMQAGIHWQTARLHVAVTGAQPRTAQVAFNGQDDGQRRHQLRAQIQYAPEQIQVAVQELAVQLPTGVWRTPQPARAVIQDQTVRVERLQLRRGVHALEVNGAIGANGPQDMQLQVTRLPLSEVRTLVGTGPDVNGELSATLLVQGTAAQPHLNADVTTSALRIANQEYAGFNARVVYQDPRLQLSAQLRQDAAHSLSIEGHMPLALSWAQAKWHSGFGEVDARLYSQGLSLAFLNQWTTDVKDVQGTLQADARVQGPLSALTLSGTAQLQDGQARIPRLGIELSDLHAAAALATDSVQVSSFQVRSGKGQLTGSGTIGLARGAGADLAVILRADAFQVIRTDQYTAALSGRLSASGSLQQPVVTGELTLEDTVLRPALTLLRSKPEPPDPTITVIRDSHDSRAATASSTQTSTIPQRDQQNAAAPGSNGAGIGYERMALDIAVTIPRDTWLNVEDGAVEFRGDLRVRKAAYEPVAVVGTLESVRGWYSYRGRKFRVEQGYIYFTGATPIDPGLDVVARYTLRDYRIDVVVGGTARQPQLSLRSEPALEQADILSLLVFGRTTAALSSGEKVSLQSQALQAAAGYLANDLRQSLAQELGVDNLEFDVGQTLSQSRVGVGKYVADDVFVSTSQQLSDASNREFAVEYSLSENWQIKASTTTRGNDGIDVFWRQRY